MLYATLWFLLLLTAPMGTVFGADTSHSSSGFCQILSEPTCFLCEDCPLGGTKKRLSCQHEFCRSCIDPHILGSKNKKGECPLCLKEGTSSGAHITQIEFSNFLRKFSFYDFTTSSQRVSARDISYYLLAIWDGNISGPGLDESIFVSMWESCFSEDKKKELKPTKKKKKKYFLSHKREALRGFVRNSYSLLYCAPSFRAPFLKLKKIFYNMRLSEESKELQLKIMLDSIYRDTSSTFPHQIPGPFSGFFKEIAREKAAEKFQQKLSPWSQKPFEGTEEEIQ